MPEEVLMHRQLINELSSASTAESELRCTSTF